MLFVVAKREKSAEFKIARHLSDSEKERDGKKTVPKKAWISGHHSLIKRSRMSFGIDNSYDRFSRSRSIAGLYPQAALSRSILSMRAFASSLCLGVLRLGMSRRLS